MAKTSESILAIQFIKVGKAECIFMQSGIAAAERNIRKKNLVPTIGNYKKILKLIHILDNISLQHFTNNVYEWITQAKDNCKQQQCLFHA